MEYILEKLEGLIDDIERDDTMDKDEILQILNEICCQKFFDNHQVIRFLQGVG